jgi:BON domain
MAEPFFGTVSQWPSMQVPAFGYPPASVTQASRPPGLFSPMASQGSPAIGGALGGSSTPHPSSADPYIFGVGTVPATGGPGFGPGLSAVVSSPIAGGLPAFAAPDIAIGVTAPALLATVAMRRGQPLGPTTDHDIEDFIYDALDLLPGTSDVEVRCEGGRATFTGSVPHKRVKRDIGEIAWALPTLNDVQNNITIAARRRSRSPSRESEALTAAGTRKPA